MKNRGKIRIHEWVAIVLTIAMMVSVVGISSLADTVAPYDPSRAYWESL